MKMKNVPFIAIVLLLACSHLNAQRVFKPLLQSTKQTVFDFRPNQTIPPPKITKAMERTVLTKLFRHYLTDPKFCNSQFDSSGDDPLKAARNAGQVVPSIADMATGSFTAPGQNQTAYIISVSECNASHADNFGTKRIAIFSGTQLISDQDIDFHQTVLLKMDLNSDGMDELLMTTGDISQGIETQMATLFDFPNGKVHVVQDFGVVTLDECGSGSPGSSTKASVLSISDIVPGTMPKLKQENYTATCHTPKRWRPLSTGKMPD